MFTLTESNEQPHPAALPNPFPLLSPLLTGEFRCMHQTVNYIRYPSKSINTTFYKSAPLCFKSFPRGFHIGKTMKTTVQIKTKCMPPLHKNLFRCSNLTHRPISRTRTLRMWISMVPVPIINTMTADHRLLPSHTPSPPNLTHTDTESVNLNGFCAYQQHSHCRPSTAAPTHTITTQSHAHGH